MPNVKALLIVAKVVTPGRPTGARATWDKPPNQGLTTYATVTMNTRRGFTLLEIFITCLLLLVLMSVCLRLVRNIAKQRRAMSWRQTAVRETSNVMESLFLLPWDELTAESGPDRTLSIEADRTLPNGQLSIDVDEVPNEPDACRILVSVRWQPKSEPTASEIRLAAWRYQPPKKPEPKPPKKPEPLPKEPEPTS